MTEELNLKVSIDSTQFRKDVEVIKNEFVNAALEIKKTVSEKSVLSQVQIGDDKSQVINTPVAKTDEKVELENLLTQYQDYVDKRLAIENKYNKDLSFLREQRELAEKNGDVAEEKRLTRAIAQAEVKRGKELITKDLEMLKQSPDYIHSFENINNASTDTLKSLLTEFQDVKDEAFTFFDAKELHEYTTIIQSILDELGKRNPFQELINRQSELADAEREFADAKKQLDAVNNGGKIITGVKNTSLEDGVIKAEYTYLSASEALEKYRKAKEKVVSANAVFLNAEKNAKEKVDELAKVLQSLGNAIGGVAGNILSLMGDITLFVTSSIESMDKMTKVGVQSMSAIEKASIILGIISAAIQVFTKIGNVIGDSYNQYEKYAEKISKINELTEAVNNYKIAALEAKQAEDSWFSENNLKNLRDFREVHTEVDEAYQSKLNEEQATYQNEEGTGWLKKIWKPITWVIDNTYGKLYGFNINKQYEEGTSSAKDNLRIETRKATKGFLGTGLGAKSQKTENLTDWAKKNGYGELFDDKGYINKTAAKEILDKYGDKLVGETKETLETLLELKEKYDEYLTQLHEYVDSLYAPLVDNFVDAIFDWLDTGKDALDSFKDYAGNTFRKIAMDMIKSMALDMVFGKGEKSFQNKVSHLYELYAEGELDELELYNRVATETSALGAKMQDSIPFLENILEVMADSLYGSTGIDIRNGDSSSSQSPISVGFQTMSQDTADELNGRFTVLQMIGEEMRMLFLQQSPLVAQMSLDMDVIKLYTQTISTDVTEMKDIALTSMNHLSAIEKNTKHLQFMREDLSKIKEKVNNL